MDITTTDNLREQARVGKAIMDLRPEVYTGEVVDDIYRIIRSYGVPDGLSEDDTFAVVTAYMGVGGLLWSLWCAYKIIFGENFGDYTLKMYRYFKNSYQILRKMNKI